MFLEAHVLLYICRTQNDTVYRVVPESHLYHVKEIEDIIRVCMNVCTIISSDMTHGVLQNR